MSAGTARFLAGLLCLLAITTAFMGWWDLFFLGSVMALFCLAESQREERR